MTADEMFKELGYEKIRHTDEEIVYKNSIKNEITFIIDDHRDKYRGFYVNGFVSLYELKAINKKCEELGWLKEE